MNLVRVGDQLNLMLKIPWDGYTARSLTKAAIAFSLASEGTGRSIQPPKGDSRQIELFLKGTPYGTQERICTGRRSDQRS